ncbi:MAG: site-specific integrase, partial [Blastocatellia bacterium]
NSRRDWYVKDTKTSSGRRTLPLSPELIARLQRHRERQAEARRHAGRGWHDRGFVFCDAIGDPLSQRIIRAAWEELREKSGLADDIRLYDARHSSATLLMAQGVAPKVVSERLGHADISITLRVYSHVMPGMQEQASEVIENALFA